MGKSTTRRAAPRTESKAGSARKVKQRAPKDDGKPAKPKAADPVEPKPSGPRRGEPLLMEIAWEACNQMGGIYTVLRSKVDSMVSEWGSRYCLVGPANQATAHIEFDEAPPTGVFGSAVQELQEMGIGAQFGRWLVTGRPQLVLLDYKSVFDRLDAVKYRCWSDHGIPTPTDEDLLNNVMAFGEVARQFLSLVARKEGSRRRLVAHFHEWMAGPAIPMLRHEQWPGSLVFTTHATVLGRCLAMNHPVFYDHLPFFTADDEAKRFNVESQHRIERAAAHGSHVFTTVSDVTAMECKHLLGRTPDLLLPNGLNIHRFAAIHEFQNLHKQFKEQIHQFTIGHFFPSYRFDLNKTLYVYTSGRYEYRNKGMDLTIEALARLNGRLRQARADGEDVPTIVAFIVTRRPVKSINVTALESRAMLDELQSTADAIKEQIGDKLFFSVATGKVPDLNTLIDDYWRLRLRRTIHAWTRDHPPPIVTHDLIDDRHDEVLNQLRACQLWNLESDPVKVVYHPDFITPTNPLFGMDYDQFVRGCHLGIFPSYYEPWGYTPLESIALGVPAITSDLAGFGSYLMHLLPDHEEKGLYVLRRRYNTFDDSAQRLTDRLIRFSQMTRRERVALRNSVESFSEHFDWHNLVKRYHEAHALALDRMG